MKKGILALLCAGAIALTGCYGSYAVFNKVHKWNGTFGNKWANFCMHVLLWIVPVYELSLLGDALLFNSIEFWSGSNPMARRRLPLCAVHDIQG